MLNFRNKKFKIVQKYPVLALISLLVIIAGFVVMAFVGMNVGVEFSAGATIEVNVKNVKDFKADKFISDFEGWLKGDRNFDGKADDNATVYRISTTQTSGNNIFEFRIGTKVVKAGNTVDLSETVVDETTGKETTALMLESKQLEDDISKAALTYLQGKYSDVTDKNIEVNSHTVDNRVMMYTIRTAIIAVSVAIVAILIYIGFRFTWISGLSAIIALCHDVLIMVAFTTIFRIPVNSTFIAAIITIIGYSINSTIVIFDRVREIERIPSMSSETDVVIANRAIADTLSRSILTNLTTLVMIGLLAILGNTSIREFALPIIFGLLGGAYSSVLLSAPCWVYLRKLFKVENKRPKLKVKAQKSETAAQEA